MTNFIFITFIKQYAILLFFLINGVKSSYTNPLLLHTDKDSSETHTRKSKRDFKNLPSNPIQGCIEGHISYCAHYNQCLRLNYPIDSISSSCNIQQLYERVKHDSKLRLYFKIPSISSSAPNLTNISQSNNPLELIIPYYPLVRQTNLGLKSYSTITNLSILCNSDYPSSTQSLQSLHNEKTIYRLGKDLSDTSEEEHISMEINNKSQYQDTIRHEENNGIKNSDKFH